MSRYKNALFLFLILIIAGGLRLYHLQSLPPGLYPDEAMNGNNALEANATGNYKVFYPENNGREGLFINIQAFVLKTVGLREPWVLRLPSAIFGILTVLGLYFLAKELLGRKVGLLAAFFLATSFWHINFSRIGFRAIMAPLLMTWALFFFLCGFRKLQGGGKALGSFYAILGGVVYGLGFYTYIAYRATPLIFFLFLPFFGKNKDFWKSMGLFLVATFIVALPIGLYFLHNPADFFGRTTQVSVGTSSSPLRDLGLNILKTAGMFNFVGDGNWRHNYSGRPELFWPVGIALWLGVILGIRELLRRGFKPGEHSSMAASLLFAWALAAAAPVVVSNEGLPHALRSILFLPPVMIFAAWGAHWFYEKLKLAFEMSDSRKKLLPLLAIFSFVFLSLLALESATTYFLLWGKNQNVPGAFAENYVELGQKLNALPDSEPKYILIKAGGTIAGGYPVPAQTVMFLTNTWRAPEQAKRNFHYIYPADESKVPNGAIEFYID